MSLLDIMIDQLAIAGRIVEDGAEVSPTWRITTPEGAFLILARFDPDKEGQGERVLLLISRYMAWKMATSFVLTEETWLPPGKTRTGEEALRVVGISHHERRALVQRFHRGREIVSFDSPEWLRPEQVDETYYKLLPTGTSEITIEEIAELSAVFGEGGELQAERLS